VFIASQFIQDGQELFLDYKFNPTLSHPSWYSPISSDKNENRWKKYEKNKKKKGGDRDE